MYLLCIYEKNIVLSLFKIDTLNFTMYILTILTWSLKTYAIRLHNLISVNIFFTERSVFLYKGSLHTTILSKYTELLQ